MVAWYCLASACTTIAARPRNWTWLIKWYVDHTSYERTLRSAAPNANYVSTGASVTYHLGTWNLASCKLCFSIISSYCSGHMISMGTGSLGWQSVQKLTGFHFNVATYGYKALHSTRELSLASKLIHYCWCLNLSPNILHYSISLRNMGNIIFEQISLRNISAQYFAQYLSCVISSRNSLP